MLILKVILSYHYFINYVPITGIMVNIFFFFLPGRSNHPVFKAVTGIDESWALFKKTLMEELSWR